MIRNPFPGPKPYRASQRAQFFGRDDVSYRLSQLVLASRCVTVFGPSGAGKSSLLQASVLPGLVEAHEARLVRVDAWPARVDPTRWLSEAMYDGLGYGTPPSDLAPNDAVITAMRRAARGSSRRIIVYLDQLEQLLYADRSIEETDGFFACLDELVELPLRATHVVLSLREDYLGRFRDRLRDRRRVLDHGFRVGPLTVAELTEAVCQAAAVGEPAQAWSHDEMRALMREVRVSGSADTDEAEAQSAFAQIVCRALFEERAAHGVRSRKTIPAEGIVRGYFETTLADLGELRASAERLLAEHLITADGSRTLRTEKELLGLMPRVELVPILEALERAAILSAEEHQGSRYFELGHDWLARRVFEARKEREAREEERLREEERRRAHEEERVAAEARLEKARAARRRLLLLALCALAFAGVTSALGVVAFLGKKAAEAAQKNAEEARKNAEEAREVALLESVEAHDLKLISGFSTLSSQGELALGLKLLGEVRLPGLRQGWVTYVSDALQKSWLRVTLRGHTGSLMAASFSPDGRHVLTASTDGTARVWRSDGTGEAVVLRGHEAIIRFAAMSPDGQRVLTLSEDTTARIFRADGSGASIVLRGAAGALVHGGFSPDGKRVVTASMDGKARVYEADGREVAVLEGHEAALTQARFLPDGARIVTASDDGTARVWDGRERFRSVKLAGHRAPVVFVAVTADGSRIVTASLDQTARVFSSDGKGEPVVLSGHDGPVLHVDVSPDGTRVATASADRAARVFPIDGKGKPRLLLGHTHAVTHVEFHPDGRFLATSSVDETARVWPIEGEPVALSGHGAPIRSVRWSPGGTELVTAAADLEEQSSDCSAKIWKMPSFAAVPQHGGKDGLMHSADLDATGKRFVGVYDDGTVRIQSIDGGAAPVRFRGHDGWVASASWSPLGDRIVTASFDRTARVWSADGRGDPIVLRGHEAAVRTAAFSPDGTRVVTAGEDNTARVFPADGNGEPVVLRGHEDWLTSASFSPDGTRVVTTSMDHTARVHRADGKGEPVVLRGHGATVVHAAFDPRGERVVTVSEDGTARVHRADGQGESFQLGVQAATVVRAAWSRDGKRVVLVSVDGLLRVWNADGSGRPIWLSTDLLPFSVSFVDGDQGILIVAASGHAHTWLIDVETLRRRIEADNAECVPAWNRIGMLGESTTEAAYRHQLCESRYGRMPAPKAAPPQRETLDPAVLERALSRAVKGSTSGAPSALLPPEPLLKDAGPNARRVKVIVLPAFSRVTVDGVAARNRAGVVEIESKVGSVHKLRVANAGVRVERDVTIGDAPASPEIVDLRPELAARAVARPGSVPSFDPMLFAGEAPQGVHGATPVGGLE